jgi:HrpA-like RNA helicase
MTESTQAHTPAQGQTFQKLRETLKALPVYGIVDDVIKDVVGGNVTVVAARTGSGKSMILPGALADATGEQVVVLVPRRFLTTDAACNVAELSGTALGKEVGFAIGQVNGEKSMHSADTKVLYCTYGYALRSGLINKARTIVLDEVHEGDEHISLARAVLYERKKTDPKLRILEMSATVNARAQAAFWQGVAPTEIHEASGSEHACDMVHESTMRAGDQSRPIEEVAVNLLQDGRKGIAVFRGGIKEVENSVLRIKELLKLLDIPNVEVVGVHSGTPSDERRAARLAPKAGWRKIIVGTNVIESGVNLRWVDAGVSDGVRKLPHHRDDTGADALVADDLSQSGLTQQLGRINRDPQATGFERGVFVLHAKNGFDSRIRQNSPAIERESLVGPAFNAACLGYDPTALQWDVTPAHARYLPERLEQAKQELMRLELVDEQWGLTKEGQFVNRLPLSPQASAMLIEARALDEKHLQRRETPCVLRDAVILAVLADNPDFKRNTKRPHGCDRERNSDVIDAMNAYRNVYIKAVKQGVLEKVLKASDETALANATPAELYTLRQNRMALEKLCEPDNVSVNGFIHTAQLVEEVNKRLGETLRKEKLAIVLTPPVAGEEYNAARYDELKRCVLNGSVNQMFQVEHDGGLRDLLRDYGKNRSDSGALFKADKIADSSIIKQAAEGVLISGNLREVKADASAKNKTKPTNGTDSHTPLLVVSNATVIPSPVLLEWKKGREERGRPVVNGEVSGNFFEGQYAEKVTFEMPVTRAVQHAASDTGGKKNWSANMQNGHSKGNKGNANHRW